MSVFLFHIYVLVKYSGDHIVYTSFSAAERACRVDSEIEEWTAYEGADRMTKTGVWIRRPDGNLLREDHNRDQQ